MKQFHTLSEIRSQPEAWAEALQVVRSRETDLIKLSTGSVQQVIFTGCGSTYYLSLAGAAVFQQLTGRTARAVPASELLLNQQTIQTSGPTLLVAVSRSGSTSETIKAVERFRQEKRGLVLAITNYGDAPLAGLGDVSLVIPAGQEQSVAQTRSFASLYLATAAFAAVAAEQTELLKQMLTLPEIGYRLISQYDTFARQTGENLQADRFYFLGSGIRYGLACEVNLKMKEMTLTHSEPFHFLEFRHGPMSMITPSAVVVGLLSTSSRVLEQAVLDEMHLMGAITLGLAETNADVVFDSRIAEPGRAVLYLPVLQLMAYYRSVAKGLNPDAPANLTAVVHLEL